MTLMRMLNYNGPKPPLAMYERGKITNDEYNALPDTCSFRDDSIVNVQFAPPLP